MSAEGGFGEMLDRYANSGAARFHMPGHKGVGAGFFADIFAWNALYYGAFFGAFDIKSKKERKALP